MRFSSIFLIMASVALAACGPTYVVQSPPRPAPERVPTPPRVEPLQVNIVRPEDGRVLIQTSRSAYLAVFEIVPGRGVSLVYPAPYRPRDVMLTGLTWVTVDWRLRPEYDRRLTSSDARYVYAVASDTPLRISDQDYDRESLERRLGGAYWSTSPNLTVRAISREFVRAQPDEWWGEDMYSMPLSSPRVTVTIRLARVYCPGGVFFDVRDDLADHIWCPAGRSTRPGERPVAVQPDSVFAANGHRVPRRVDPGARTPVYRVPATVDVQQQGHASEPRNPVPFPPRGQPQNPQLPAANHPPATMPPAHQPPANQPPATNPPANQPPQAQPPQNPPAQTPPQDPNAGGRVHDDNGRRAHGDPRNADPRGNGNGYGNGGREQPPATTPPVNTPPANPPQSAPQPPQQHGDPHGPPQSAPGNGHGNSSPGNSGNTPNSGNTANPGNGKGPSAAKPDHNNAAKPGLAEVLRNRAPGAQKQDKKAPSDSSDKKKP